MAATTNGQKHTEVPWILQLLLPIRQRLFPHHTTIVQFNKERNPMELDN
jgi:hypothetical protein